MITIRRSVFETNSSSAHTLAIAKTDHLNDKLFIDQDGVCKIFFGEFGWGPDTYYDAASKASYCLTAATESNNTGQLEMLRNVIKQQTGATTVVFEETHGYQKQGYVDHQSEGVANAAFENEEALKAFIFNKGSELVIDNDNH